jgi:hypothetical protein
MIKLILSGGCKNIGNTLTGQLTIEDHISAILE